MLKFYPSWFVFMSTLLLGLSLVASSNNWFMAWIGFELLVMGFLPMFSTSTLIMESMIKYFLIQAMGSSLFIISFMMMSSMSSICFTTSLLLKLGLFPFHQWVPIVMSSTNWLGCFLLSTIQKLAPMMMLTIQQENTKFFILLSAGVSIVISGMLGYNQTYMRSLMGYSSISHTSWMMVSVMFNIYLFVFYFLLYCYFVGILFFTFHYHNINKVVSSYTNPKSVSIMALSMLVLSGIPPFSFFFLKATLIFYLTSFPIIAPLFIVGAVLSIYFYLMFIIPTLTAFWKKEPFWKSNWTLVFAIWGALLFPFCFMI